MKAIVCTQYGPPDALQFKEVPIPAPTDDEILIKLYAASVNPLDSYIMRGPLFFLPTRETVSAGRHGFRGKRFGRVCRVCVCH